MCFNPLDQSSLDITVVPSVTVLKKQWKLFVVIKRFF